MIVCLSYDNDAYVRLKIECFHAAYQDFISWVILNILSIFIF